MPKNQSINQSIMESTILILLSPYGRNKLVQVCKQHLRSLYHNRIASFDMPFPLEEFLHIQESRARGHDVNEKEAVEGRAVWRRA